METVFGVSTLAALSLLDSRVEYLGLGQAIPCVRMMIN